MKCWLTGSIYERTYVFITSFRLNVTTNIASMRWEKERTSFVNKMAPLKSHVPYIRSRSYRPCPLIMQRSYIACHFLPECKRPGTFNIQVDFLQTVCGVWESDGNAKLTSLKSLSVRAFLHRVISTWGCLPFVKYFWYRIILITLIKFVRYHHSQFIFEFFINNS